MKRSRMKCAKTVAPLAGFGMLAFALLIALSGAHWGAASAVQQTGTDRRSQLSVADQILGEMSRMTSLPIKAPLKKQIVSRPEVEKYLTGMLHAEYTPEEMHVQEAVLRALGLVSPDFNLEKFLVAFYAEQAAGFYDPHTKTMYIADWVAADMQTMVLAHELTHALQDQNFDLDKFMHASKDNDDATSARQAVAEGHAMAAMMQHALGGADLAAAPSLEPLMASVADQQLKEFPTFATAPYFFRLQALFPYLQGMTFMQRGLAKGGWKSLNTLFTNPPSTTKELFEPEIYFAHQALPKVSLPTPAVLSTVSGLRLLTQNTMGELGYFALIGQLISEDEAKRVATAWLADRYVLYEYSGKMDPAEKFVLLSRVKWSSADKAGAFFRDYQTILQKKHPELAPDARSGGDLYIGGVGASRAILMRKGDEVLWAEGIPANQADAILNYLRSLN